MAAETESPAGLPEVIAVFPLTGILVFPGMTLPLHIFEPRYRALVEDSLAGDGVFGMIQPIVPQRDNRPLPGAEKESPELYDVGCAGRVERWEKLEDGRYLIELRGLSRFRAVEELPIERGYRRLKASYEGFPDSPPDQAWRCDRAGLVAAVEAYARHHGLLVKLDRAEELSDIELVNLLGMSLPFHPAEKQAMLEAPSLEERRDVLLDLLRLGAGNLNPTSSPAPRTVH
jgi:hypothetical protein